ncbi:MAG: 50S ribosomal protein L24 [Candidatus Vogelbacteria bacterium]|nr:50S ribosomal protein L24 [Candidatus Vogelbacteria bacterium]
MHVKKGDLVRIITGKNKGKEGKIIKAWPRLDRILVEGANLIKRRERARKSGQKGQVVTRPAPIHVSNVKKID